MTSPSTGSPSLAQDTVAVFVGNSKVYLDASGFRPHRTYIVRVRDTRASASSALTPISSEAVVFDEASYLAANRSRLQQSTVTRQPGRPTPSIVGFPSQTIRPPFTLSFGDRSFTPTVGLLQDPIIPRGQQTPLQVRSTEHVYLVFYHFSLT